MNTKPLVSIIVVNYNSSEVLVDLLDSLYFSEYSNIEIIVVDNASPSDDVSIALEDYPKVQLIQSEENVGFAAANNIGIKKAKGAYFLFLNPDVVVQPGFIEPMLEAFALNPLIGLISPKIMYYDNPSLIQYAGCSEMSPITLRTVSYGKGKEDSPLYRVSRKTNFGHGAAMMVPRKIVAAVGLMNEAYFLYYEEMDWCHRIRAAGYQIYYIASSHVYHKESYSVQKNSPLKMYYLSRNRLLFARFHRSTWQVLLFLLYNLFVLVPKNICKYYDTPALLKSYFRGMVWHIDPS